MLKKPKQQIKQNLKIKQNLQDCCQILRVGRLFNTISTTKPIHIYNIFLQNLQNLIFYQYFPNFNKNIIERKKGLGIEIPKLKENLIEDSRKRDQSQINREIPRENDLIWRPGRRLKTLAPMVKLGSTFESGTPMVVLGSTFEKVQITIFCLICCFFVDSYNQFEELNG